MLPTVRSLLNSFKVYEFKFASRYLSQVATKCEYPSIKDKKKCLVYSSK